MALTLIPLNAPPVNRPPGTAAPLNPPPVKTPPAPPDNGSAETVHALLPFDYEDLPADHPLQVPVLLIQLQDDLSRSRLREAFWISVVAHLLILITAHIVDPGQDAGPSTDTTASVATATK